MRAVNPNAQPEVQRVLDYLEENRGNRLILGQHTQTMEQPELEHIRRITGNFRRSAGLNSSPTRLISARRTPARNA